MTKDRTWTVEEFDDASARGLVSERSQLVDGEVWEHVAPGPRHIQAVGVLEDAFEGLRPLGLRRWSAQPLTSGPLQQPEPDVMLVRRRDRAAAGLPQAEDAVLVVEVADTSLTKDQQQKVPLYAEAGVPELWLVDLVHDVVVRHREPSGRVWRQVEEVRNGLLAPEAAPEHRSTSLSCCAADAAVHRSRRNPGAGRQDGGGCGGGRRAMTSATRDRTWTVEEFLDACARGLLDGRSQLVDGAVREHVTSGPRHVWAVLTLARVFHGVGPLGLVVAQDQPLLTGPTGVPEHDLALLRAAVLSPSRLPVAGEAALVVEVADSSLLRDQRQKVPLYAEAGVPELWLVDLVHDVVVRHREPSGRSWRQVDEVRDGLLAPGAAPQHPVDVAELLRR